MSCEKLILGESKPSVMYVEKYTLSVHLLMCDKIIYVEIKNWGYWFHLLVLENSPSWEFFLYLDHNLHKLYNSPNKE